MDPVGVTAVAYTAETVVEAGAAAYVISKPPMPLNLSFQRIPLSTQLPRSSHTVSVVKGKTYIFGGEIEPRKPVDNVMHVVTLPASGVDQAEYTPIPPVPETPDGPVPEARVGHTASVIEGWIFIFGGRGGKDMKPLEEKGRVWVFDTTTSKWSFLDPASGSPFPEPRSYHASASAVHAAPKAQDNPVLEEPAVWTHAPPPTRGTLFIHAGCPASGRLSDLWAFDVASRFWASLPPGPDPPRGGTSIVYANGSLWRFGGFDGKTELGDSVDYLELTQAPLSVQDEKGEQAKAGIGPLVAKTDKWESISYTESRKDPSDPVRPGPRSVAGIHAVSAGMGRTYLLAIMGEKDPSSKGHDGAGRFWDDVWSFQLPAEGWSGAKVKDVVRKKVGAESGEGKWILCRVDDKQARPGPRGWFSSSAMGDAGKDGVVLWGGLNESNEREGDGWILTVK